LGLSVRVEGNEEWPWVHREKWARLELRLGEVLPLPQLQTQWRARGPAGVEAMLELVHEILRELGRERRGQVDALCTRAAGGGNSGALRRRRSRRVGIVGRVSLCRVGLGEGFM
jgi:hypothetical protein